MGQDFLRPGHDTGGHRSARAPCHDPGDERRELSPESRAQTRARPSRLTVTPRNRHSGALQGLTATTAVPPCDGCQGSDFTSLSGSSGNGAIFGAHRSVANDPTETDALFIFGVPY